MKLLTARVADDYRLHIETPTGFVDVDAAATLADEPALHGLMDVGALLRADDTVRAALARAGQHLARAWQPLPARPLEALTLAPPILAPSKIICVGHNYRAHVAEGGAEIPAEPLLFAKCANALIGHGDQILYPSITTQLDYEGELAIIIGRRASRVPESRAMDYVAGFTIMNDISARDLQHGVSQWFYGKSLDTFAPLGPCVVTVDAAGPYASMRLQTRVNGELRQDSSCGDMIFGPEQLIAFIARAITLEPGDIIATGTPSGVGLGFHPPRYLTDGDVIEISIDMLGTLRSSVVTRTDL